MAPRNHQSEIAARAKELYDRELRDKLEPGNKGKYLVIDVDTGEYEMDEDGVAAMKRAYEKRRDGRRFAMRIGYPAMGRIGFAPGVTHK
jgi:hypothetical protein